MIPIAPTQPHRSAVGPEPDEQRDADHDAGGEQVAQQARDDVAGEHRARAQRHRAEAVDDAGLHVAGDVDGGGCRAESRAQQDDARHDVVDVAARRIDRAAEHEREQQHEHHGEHDRHEQRLAVAQRVAQAPRHEDALGGEAGDARTDAGRLPARGAVMRSPSRRMALRRCAAVGRGEGEEDVVEARAAQGHDALGAGLVEDVECAAEARDGAVRRHFAQQIAVRASCSSTVSPPTRALSCAAVPVATTRPPSSTAMRSASWSASSRYCVVRKHRGAGIARASG